jgi:hypothetical protein
MWIASLVSVGNNINDMVVWSLLDGTSSSLHKAFHAY